MRVLFDYQAFDLQTHGGVSRCMLELYRNLPSSIQPLLGVFETDNVYLQEDGYNAMESTYRYFLGIERMKGKRRLFTPYFRMRYGFDYWGDRNKNYSIKLLNEGNYDVFHPTFFDDYFLEYLNGKPFVLTIHDMIPELFPQYFDINDFQIEKKKVLAPLAAHIVVPSEQTKNDVVRLLNIPQEKVTVIYHGTNSTASINWNENTQIIDCPYILYVGARDKYKNFENFVQTTREIIKKNKDWKVICTGTEFTSAETNMLTQYGVNEQYECRFVKSEYDLMNLYHYAVAFVFPSLYEGFGLPILECYQADGLLVLNNTSCFPEIAGDAALYFSQDGKGNSLAEILELVLQMTVEQRKEQLKKQRERLKWFSWRQSATQLAEVYHQLLK